MRADLLTPLARIFTGCLLLAICSQTSNAAAAETKSPRCALIAAEQSPIVALLEAKLLEEPNTDWLERGEIEKLFAEQKLQALLSADAVKQRAELGKILKSDVLVMLEAGVKEVAQKKQKFADLVVAETKGGMRLLVRTVPLTDDADADSAAIAALVRKGLAKNAEKTTQVFAIPPFVSQNLTYEHDHLREAYSRLMEQALLDRPGVLVVELAEAESLAREFQLSAADAKVVRQLPSYLLGEYRHEQKEDDLTVNLTLALNRGTKQISTRTDTMTADDVPPFLLKMAARLAKIEGQQDVVYDPAAEAKQLGDRARVFLKLGNWSEGLALVEASLLLDANQLDMRAAAIHATNHLYEELDYDRLETPRVEFGLRQRAFEHFRIAAPHRLETVGELMLSIGDYSLSKQTHVIPPALAEAYARQRKLREATFRQLSDQAADERHWRMSAWLLELSMESREPDQQREEWRAYILRNQDRAGGLVSIVAEPHYRESRLTLPQTVEGRRFLSELASSAEANEQVRREANRLLASAQKPTQTAQPARDASSPAGRLTFQPWKFEHVDRSGQSRPIEYFANCLRLDNGTDVLVTGGRGMLVRGKGDFVQFASDYAVSSAVFDGRYVWMSAELQSGELAITILDPGSGQTWRITKENGLPLLNREESRLAGVSSEIHLAPIGPGRAIVAGWVGRLWLAHVTFDPQGAHAVKIFHEAKEVPQRDAYQASLKSPHAAISPSYALTLTGTGSSGKPDQVVAIGRSGTVGQALLINPDDLSVKVFGNDGDHRLPAFLPTTGLYKGELYYTELTHPWPAPLLDRRVHLFKVGSSLKPVRVLADVMEGQVFFDTDGINIIGKEWWRGKIGSEPLQSLGPVPWRYSSRVIRNEKHGPPAAGEFHLLNLVFTHHFGIIAQCREGGRTETAVVRVLLDGSGTSFKEALRYPERWVDGRLKPIPKGFETKPQGTESLWQRKRQGFTRARFSPDGKLLLTSSAFADRAVQIWKADTGGLVATLPHTEGMHEAAFSTTGKYFATGTNEGLIILRTTEGLEVLHDIQQSPDKIEHLNFSWDDRLLVSRTAGRVCRVWSVDSGKQELELVDPGVFTKGIDFTPDGKRLLISRSQEGCEYWDLATGQPAGRIDSLAKPAGFLSDKTFVGAAMSSGRSLIAWDTNTETYRMLWRDPPPGEVKAISSDGRSVAMWQYWGFVEGKLTYIDRMQIWDIATGEELASRDKLKLLSMVFSPDGNTFIGVDPDQLLRIELKAGSASTDRKRTERTDE